MDCARPSDATPARSPACGPTICWPASSRRWWRARASRPTSSTTCPSAAPRRRARTAATSRATRCCWPACRSRRRATVHNRLCGSGLNALVGAAHAITCGEADVCVAGGVESMTRAPFVVGKAEQPFTKNFTVFDSTLGARFPNPKIESLFGADTMPETVGQPGARLSALARGVRPVRAGLAAEIRQGRQGRLLQERDQAGLDPAGQGQAGRGRRATTSIRAPTPPWTACRS